jgi:hypothetical protein
MIKNPMSKRRCRRCAGVSHSPLPNSDEHQQQNTHRLCDKCLKWSKENPTNPVKAQ